MLQRRHIVVYEICPKDSHLLRSPVADHDDTNRPGYLHLVAQLNFFDYRKPGGICYDLFEIIIRKPFQYLKSDFDQSYNWKPYTW